MTKHKKSVVTRICLFVGTCLLIAATIIFIAWQWEIKSSEQSDEIYVQIIYESIPDSRSAVPEERIDNAMSVLSLDGTDFVGVLEMPGYNSAQPVCNDWGDVTKYPCKFDGSIYDRSMKIGATSQKGQYDFYNEIYVGDLVVFTDMEGNRYTYEVTELCYEKHADQNTLEKEESALTLFIKNIYDLNYLIVYCNVLN